MWSLSEPQPYSVCPSVPFTYLCPIHPHTVSVFFPPRLSLSNEFKMLHSNQRALEVMHAMIILDLIGIQKGLVKVTESLKKMKGHFKPMHNTFELDLAKSEFNQFTRWAFYEGRAIQGTQNNWICVLYRSRGSNCVSSNIEIFFSSGWVLGPLQYPTCWSF